MAWFRASTAAAGGGNVEIEEGNFIGTQGMKIPVQMENYNLLYAHRVPASSNQNYFDGHIEFIMPYNNSIASYDLRSVNDMLIGTTGYMPSGVYMQNGYTWHYVAIKF